jgi:hyperosmotically inducible protein
MKKIFGVAAAVLCSATMAAYADSATHAQTKANKEQAEADYKTAKANCKSMSGADKKACLKDAKANYKASKATAKTDAKADVANNTAR